MESSTSGLKIAAGVVITMLVIAIGFGIYTLAKSTSDNALHSINKLNTQLAEAEFTDYDSEEISGSEVINAIKRFKDEIICITVDNGRTSTEYIMTSSLTSKSTNTIEAAKNKTDLNHYINPNGIFKGTIIRDSGTDAIIGITFKKK